MAESFDAVLAEMRLSYNKPIATSPTKLEFADRLQSAHEAEVAELQRIIREHFSRAEREMTDRFHAESRADRAVALLRKCRAEFAGLPRSLGYDFTHLPEIDAFLSEQAGERENGNG